MRIWVDGQCLQSPSRERGIGRYVAELSEALAARPVETVHVEADEDGPGQDLTEDEQDEIRKKLEGLGYL